MKDLKTLKLDAALMFIHEFEMYLRSKDKYSEVQETTWSEVREIFLEMRSNRAIYDLFNMDEEDDV